jgi:hypothetical protein
MLASATLPSCQPVVALVRRLSGSVSSHATFIFAGTACTLAPLKGGRAHDMPALPVDCDHGTL